jgi:hypothetical protein
VLVIFICFDDFVFNFVLALFINAVGPESKEERFETNCQGVKLK